MGEKTSIKNKYTVRCMLSEDVTVGVVKLHSLGVRIKVLESYIFLDPVIKRADVFFGSCLFFVFLQQYKRLKGICPQQGLHT